MTGDAEFLRSIAHAAEIGDPIEERDLVRMREIADRIATREQVGWIDEHGQLWSLQLRSGDVTSDRPVFA